MKKSTVRNSRRTRKNSVLHYYYVINPEFSVALIPKMTFSSPFSSLQNPLPLNFLPLLYILLSRVWNLPLEPVRSMKSFQNITLSLVLCWAYRISIVFITKQHSLWAEQIEISLLQRPNGRNMTSFGLKKNT